MTWRRGVDAEAAPRPQIVRSWRGLHAAKNGLLARFIRCVKERRRWRRHPISREAPSERRMIACPSGGFRVQPRKYYFFWTAKGRTARGEMEREDIHWIHSFIAGRREQRAHACVKSRRERWIDGRCKRQREEGRGTNRALILIVSLPSSRPPSAPLACAPPFAPNCPIRPLARRARQAGKWHGVSAAFNPRRTDRHFISFYRTKFGLR